MEQSEGGVMNGKYIMLLCGLLLLLVSCDMGSWDGDMEGTQIYILDVEQNSNVLIFNVTVDQVALDELKASLAGEEKEYQPPEEIFFWMDPIQDGTMEMYEENRFHPVARKKVDPESTSFSVSVDLKQLAMDWNIYWLTDMHFDTEDYENDNMIGCNVFMSDGYKNYWDDNGTQIDGEYYSFDYNRPAGNGYSNLRTYPNADETWATFTLMGEGLFRSHDNVLGESPFFINLNAYNSPLGANQIHLSNGYGTDVYLDATNNVDSLSDEPNEEYVWKLEFVAAPGADPDTVYITGATPDTWFNMNYDWFYSDFYYIGIPTYVLRTDFDSDHLGFDPFSDLTYSPAAGNNWHIAEPDAGVQPLNAVAGNQVLGIGDPDINSNYADMRNDTLTFPAQDLYTASNNGSKEIWVSFRARVEMDYNWNDRVIFEMEIPMYSDWYWMNSLEGPLDTWMLQQNNGWTTYEFSIWPGDFDSGNLQSFRLRFESDDWSNYPGVYIDDLKIYTLN
jgi:hypothetical protein